MFKTDHKIILASVRSISYRSKVVHSGTAHKKWDVKLLANEKKRSEFSKSVLKRLEQTQFNTTDTGSFWGQLKEVLTGAAEEAIPPGKMAPMSPITRRAYAKLQGKINRQKRFPDVERCRTETVLARSEFEQAKKEHIWRTWRNFFTNLNCADPYMWLKKTFEFLKSQKRMKGRNLGRCSISQFKWLESLYEAVTEGRDIPLLPESTPPVSFPAPTVGEIRAIIANFRNSTSPGSDMINVELLKKAPDEFVEKLHELIAVVWNSNVPPADFIDTVQVPIPKKPSPKATTDFRKITLCNVVYKVIATHLLYKLDEVTGELPTYQAAFLANRSVEDHIFTSKRITEEYWNHGISLYALALDIRQAFDSVSHAAVIKALQTLGVPNFLVNRVINLALKEKTCLRWMNQRTPKVNKGKGVKQGRPLSPRLFTLVLHWILLKLKQLHPSVNLEHSVGMKPPFILAYADDLMIITSSLKEMDEIMWSHIVGGFHLTSKASVRYLGAYLTATVNRPESVKRRCSQGSRVSKAILPF
ncbi:uncharacterized protein LOC119770109 [Culex quinquefasciatus]|uniref:uncharacterized protein LOC119770109 n=1 Tax=Culex quinquefasciatus TaxID=7176 RepID=UPI0018E3E569|nr:uncharacterized protein LOC119770109 [Culex quinquefasciatus]